MKRLTVTFGLGLLFIGIFGCEDTGRNTNHKTDAKTKAAHDALDEMIKQTDKLISTLKIVVDEESAKAVKADVGQIIGRVIESRDKRNSLIREMPELRDDLYVAANAGRLLEQINELSGEIVRIRELPQAGPAVKAVLEALVPIHQ